MWHIRNQVFVFVIVGFLLPASSAEQPQQKPHRMVLIQGFGASTKLSDFSASTNEFPFVKKMERMFTEMSVLHDVVAFSSASANENPSFLEAEKIMKEQELDRRICDRDRVFKLITMCDIFYFTGHAGTPSDSQEQVFTVRPREGKDRSDGVITASQLRKALEGQVGPRLVILNGCRTTAPNDPALEHLKLSSAFGINQDTQGRAYLGWPVSASRDSDEFLYEFLKIWRVLHPEHGFPTLAQAKELAIETDPNGVGRNIAKLDIIGDKSLRFAKEYRLHSSTGATIQPTLYFARRGPHEADAVYDVTVNKEAFTAKNVPYIFHLTGRRSGESYSMTGDDFTRYVNTIEKQKTDPYAEIRMTPLPTWMKVEIVINGRVTTVWNAYPVESGVPTAP